ncbi:hypothetical protein FHR92_001318 [Fontibacillus solani]|uniref:Uncharacterized protein n=1 Tax=Fontibacillus solani TaxID=1572857 RepID=A0A7W3XQP4_9BACL|nr:hypothetical protein [Fontibacillus solani]
MLVQIMVDELIQRMTGYSNGSYPIQRNLKNDDIG